MQIHFVIKRKIEDRRAADTGGAKGGGHMQEAGLHEGRFVRMCVSVGLGGGVWMRVVGNYRIRVRDICIPHPIPTQPTPPLLLIW